MVLIGLIQVASIQNIASKILNCKRDLQYRDTLYRYFLTSFDKCNTYYLNINVYMKYLRYSDLITVFYIVLFAVIYSLLNCLA